MEEVLIKAGIPRSEAPGIIENMWSDGTALEYTQPVDEDVEQLFKILKQQGIKIAVCTSSTREVTIRSMKKIGLDYYWKTIHDILKIINLIDVVYRMLF